MYTSVPLHLDITQQILLEDGPATCKKFLPERCLYSSSLMIEALCCALEVDKDKLHLDVKNILHESHTEVAAVVDQWLLEMGTSWAQYLTKVVNCKSSVDGLFAWLAAVLQETHLNIIHAKGIWTTWCSDITVLTDPTVVYVVRCFITTPAMHLSDPAKSKDSESDPEYVCPFFEPVKIEANFIPQVLNDPVRDMAARLGETGLVQDTMPLQSVLVELMGCSAEEYYDLIMTGLVVPLPRYI